VKRALCALVLLAATFGAMAGSRAPTLPREAFLRQSPIFDARLSPDGRAITFLRRDEGRVAAWWQDVATGQRVRLLDGKRGIAQAWSGDGRRLWLADESGLAVVDADARKAKRILRWKTERRQRFYGVDVRATRFALVRETTERSGKPWHVLLLVDATGATRVLQEGRQPVRGVLLREDGNLAYSTAYDSAAWDTVVRAHSSQGVRELARCIGIEACELVDYDARRGVVWMLSQHGEDKFALRLWRAGRWTTLHRDPAGIADASALSWDWTHHDWRAIAYDGARRAWFGRDAATREALAALQRRFPGARLHVSATRDGRLWLVRAQRSDWAVDRHVVFRPDRDRTWPLFSRDDAAVRAPVPAALVIARPVTWRGRDGMALHGYVYLPRGIAPAKAPLIAWLHGGPFVQVVDDFQPQVQLLVNRGYAVFLPNFRSSTGYGLAYTRAAHGDFGNGRVLRDVLDGLDALLAQGIGDRTRQAVMGHSFGGYLSLVAASHAPDRFRVVLAGAPSADYGWLKRWQVAHENASLRGDGPPLSIAFPQFGLPVANPAWRATMMRESPSANIARLRTPIYLWAGARDDRTPLKGIVAYATQARRDGKAVTLLVDPDAVHEPEPPIGADAWLYLVESAADAHFGGGTTPPSPALETFLRRTLRIAANARRNREKAMVAMGGLEPPTPAL
jgi:dipeptidyl aminopeptidase/acylaminoacyl peptidase